MARPPLTLAASIASILTVALALVFPRASEWLDLRAYDLLLRPVRRSTVVPPVAVVVIDDASIAAIGQWPWPRGIVAQLLDRLREMGATVVAVDVLFSERDRSTHAPEGGATSGDVALAEAIGRGRVVLGYAFTFGEGAATAAGCSGPPLRAALVTAPGLRTPEERLFQAAGAVCAIDDLVSLADGSGFLNVGVDSDGTLRRLPLVMAHGGRIYPSLALAAVQVALGTPAAALATSRNLPLQLTLGQRKVGLDERGTLALRFRDSRDNFPHLSAADVLNGRMTPESVRNRVVFVGATALGVRDAVVTPAQVQQPGIEVHATAAENLLAGTFVVIPRFHWAAEVLVAIALGVAVAFFVSGFGYHWGALAASATLVICWIGSSWLLRLSDMYVSPVLPTAVVMMSLVTTGLTSMMFERRRAEVEHRRRRQAHEFVVKSLTSVMEMRDASTGRHSRRTQGYSRLLAQQLSRVPTFREYLTPARVELIALLAPLHDIGKIGIRDAVLNKPSALTQEEMQEMRMHPVYGFETISKTQQQVGIDSALDEALLQIAKDIVYTHHERWDGTGYPRGLSAVDIPVAGRILAVVDVYDALVEPRPYRPRLAHEQAVELIVAGGGTQFDPAVVDAFLTVAPDFVELGARLRETAAAV